MFARLGRWLRRRDAREGDVPVPTAATGARGARYGGLPAAPAGAGASGRIARRGAETEAEWAARCRTVLCALARRSGVLGGAVGRLILSFDEPRRPRVVYGAGERVFARDVAAWRAASVVAASPAFCTALCVDPAGRWLAVGDADGNVVFQRGDGRRACKRHSTAHFCTVAAIAAQPRAKDVVASGGSDGVIRLWRLDAVFRDGEDDPDAAPRQPEGEEGPNLAFNLAFLEELQLANGRPQRRAAGITALVFVDDATLVSCDSDGVVLVHVLDRDACVLRPAREIAVRPLAPRDAAPHDGGFARCCASLEPGGLLGVGPVLLRRSGVEYARSFDCSSDKPLDAVGAVAFVRRGGSPRRALWIVGVEQSIRVYDVGFRSADPTLVATLNDHEHTVRGISAADDGSWFASVGGGSTKRRLFIWSADEGAAGKIVVFMRFRTNLDVSALAVAAVQRRRRTDGGAGPW